MSKPGTSNARQPAGKPRRRAPTKKRASSKIDRRPNPLGDEWEAFVDRVRSAIQVSINQPSANKGSPYEQPTSVLKRMVYEFQIENRRKTKGIHVETAIDKFRHAQEQLKNSKQQKLLRTPQKAFKSEYYYWILSGLSCALEVGKFKIAKSDVTRFSKQLKYARRHKVPLEYLIGFLYQCGTISEVCRKADDSDHREEWYVLKQRAQANSPQ